ncbi:hypothetical protein ARMSODRAFT_1022320 [Armillaria solidipes]|uniref:ELYS-like domain-containing protein n=1 Tax=Armillaria solidipes TaxID=1076256 RepID=A0A2H3BER6_9AGAR|nr:hypothetical protein ARMSODRAFT_1022320 [Armillaria solidipes]
MVNSYGTCNGTVSPADPRALRSLPALVDFMFHEQCSKAEFDLICVILAFGLENHVTSAYDIFLDFRSLGNYLYQLGLVKLIRAYVTGLAHAPEIDIPPTIVEQHLNSFHHPYNIFLARIILITSREDPVKDLLALVYLRPWDPSWAICLQNIRQAMSRNPCAEKERRDVLLAVGVTERYISGERDMGMVLLVFCLSFYWRLI